MGLLGAHVSVSGGLDLAPERGDDLKCEAIQIFTKNQKQWFESPLDETMVSQYQTKLGNSAVQSVIVHDSYLINLGSPDADKLERSRSAFLHELNRAEVLKTMGLVFHPGSHLKMISEDDCLQIIAESLNILIDKTKGYAVKVLAENTAGQGTNVGYSFEHLARIFELVEDKSRMGVCFDTCHAYAAGYDISTEEGYEKTFKAFDGIVGLEQIKAFHVNDSKKELSSRVDRHENIGNGYIGITAFKCLVNDKRFSHVPMVLETPGGDEWYKKDLALLRELINKN